MAFTVAKSFDDFDANRRLTDAQKASVRERHDIVEGHLRTAFAGTNMPLLRTVRIGSASRDTMLRPPEDIDILAVFDDTQVWSTYQYDSQAFLYRVRDALKAVSAVRLVGARGQAVRFFYTDAPWVDVAPVCPLWNARGHMLPRGDGTWIRTDPEAQNAFLARRHQELNYKLRRLCRFVKAWNRAHSKRLSGFHIEVLVQAVFGSLGDNRRDALWKFFDWAPNYLHVSDPAGHGGDLAAGLTYTQQQAVLQSFASARDRAARALSYEAVGDHASAIAQWRIILGDAFPPYG